MSLFGVHPVSDREAQVLQHLWRLRFLTGSQICEFVFGGSPVKPTSRVVMTQRLLASLKRRSLVATLPPVVGKTRASEARPVYHLSADGMRTARLLWSGPSPKRSRSGSYLARHALATAEVIISFRRSSAEDGAYELVAWECDWQAALPLGSTWVEPDAYLLYRFGQRRFHAFLEVDLASEHARFVAGKMRRYLQTYRFGNWHERFPVWPLILVVAETESRVTQLRRIAEAVSAVPGGGWDAGASFRFATLAEVIGTRGPLGEIWQPLGNEHRLSLVPEVPTATTGRQNAKGGVSARVTELTPSSEGWT